MPTDYVSDVARIAAMDNPVLRNLEVTECYADLSEAMRARTSGAADWCMFATWASRQAGSTIRGEGPARQPRPASREPGMVPGPDRLLQSDAAQTRLQPQIAAAADAPLVVAADIGAVCCTR